jgi:hypothetical protein
MTAEEMDETQSYIEQMVAAASARPVPEPEPEMDLEDLAFGDDPDEFGEVAEAEVEDEFELPEDEFALESEDE